MLTLLHRPNHIIQQLLLDGGLGTNPDDEDNWPIFRGKEPATPDEVITSYWTSGRLAGRIQLTGEQLERWGIQLRVRSADESDGAVKAQALADYLDRSVRRTDVALGSNIYMVHSMNRVGSVMSIGKESPTSKRNIFTVNYLASLTREV